MLLRLCLGCAESVEDPPSTLRRVWAVVATGQEGILGPSSLVVWVEPLTGIRVGFWGQLCCVVPKVAQAGDEGKGDQVFWLQGHIWESPACTFLIHWQVGEGIPSLWGKPGQQGVLGW